jgi:hypothetical protein
VTGSPGETVLTGDGAATPMAAAVPCGVSGAMVGGVPSTLPPLISCPGFRAML